MALDKAIEDIAGVKQDIQVLRFASTSASRQEE
jgi:hypothetical protein